MTGPRYDLEAWRREIPLLRNFIPMNNCSQAPQTRQTREAAERYLESWATDGMDWDRWITEVERARATFARLINSDPEHVAVSTSVSQAVSSLASALDFGHGRSTLVVTEAEFPTVGHVWAAQQRRGADLRWVPVRDGLVELDDYERLVDENTLLVSACHGYYQTGFKQDLSAIIGVAHEQGAKVFVDAYQTLGTHPVDVQALGVDALASGNLKFLMGVPGIAFLYVHPDLARLLEPTVTGWFGRVDPFAFDVRGLDWAVGARRFDLGTPPIIEAYVAGAGMEVIEEVGPDAIREWTEGLAARLIERGRERGLELLGTDDVTRRTPSTAFHCPLPSHEVEAHMRTKGVIASARGSAIRLAPHFYSTFDDVDRAVDALAEALADQGALTS